MRRFFSLASSVISCRGVNIGWGTARDAWAGSVRCRAEATYEPVLRQRDPNRVGDVETNRAQLNDDATVDERNPLDAMRLRAVEPNNITSPQVMSCDLVHRHVPSVGAVMALPPTDFATLLSVIDDEGHRPDIRRSECIRAS